tara:strand:- start:582 stop:1322 length:741 start_codon:yes stop_codon:yes gene_type:complete
MANELKIVSGETRHRWHVDADGKVIEHDENAPSNVWVNDTEPMTQAVADAIRGLIVDLREDGTLEDMPAGGLQYPSIDVAVRGCLQHCEAYLRSWTDDCDEELGTQAWMGVSFDVEWSDPKAPVEPAYEWIAGEPVIVDEKHAASEEEQPQSEESLGGEEEIAGAEMVPGQVCSSEGDEGAEVEAWQTIANEIVNQTDINLDLVENDGVFGPKTVEITKAVQEYLEIPVTGSCDQVTWDTVLNLYQ